MLTFSQFALKCTKFAAADTWKFSAHVTRTVTLITWLFTIILTIGVVGAISSWPASLNKLLILIGALSIVAAFVCHCVRAAYNESRRLQDDVALRDRTVTELKAQVESLRKARDDASTKQLNREIGKHALAAALEKLRDKLWEVKSYNCYSYTIAAELEEEGLAETLIDSIKIDLAKHCGPEVAAIFVSPSFPEIDMSSGSYPPSMYEREKRLRFLVTYLQTHFDQLSKILQSRISTPDSHRVVRVADN